VKKTASSAGEDVEGMAQSEIEKIRARSPEEGLAGISPRFVINALSNAIIQSRAKSLTTMDCADRPQGRDRVDIRIDARRSANGWIFSFWCARTSTTAG